VRSVVGSWRGFDFGIIRASLNPRSTRVVLTGVLQRQMLKDIRNSVERPT
jgi:hypothetical protein